MRNIIEELPGQSGPRRFDLILVNDNQARVANLDNFPYKPKIKHLDTKFNWIREEIHHGSTSMRYEPTNLMSADGLMKTLDHVKHLRFCKTIGL